MEQGRNLIALLALDDRGTAMCANRTRYANTPVILRQVDMALALGCETLILLAVGPDDSDALAAQHLAEANGMRFHLLTRPQQLPALMPDNAELILIAPGAVAADTAALQELLGSEGLLTIPVESENANGLERLDLHTAWGGALRMAGCLTEQIEPLGNECELMSALPRIARSSGVAERPVPGEAIEAGRWLMDGGSPGSTAAIPAVREVSSMIVAPLARIFGKKNWPVYLPMVLAIVLMFIAAVALWFERPAIVMAVLVAVMLALSLQTAVKVQAEPLRLSGAAVPLWVGFLPLVPETCTAITAGQALAQSGGTGPAAYAAAALLGASWLSRRTTMGGYGGLTSGPVLWLMIAGIGALGFWWTAVGAATAAAFVAIALELRSLRRITQS